MTARSLTLLAERWLDEVILEGQVANVDGDVNDDFLPPEGIGDIAILEVLVDVSGIATMMVNPELRGPRVTVLSRASDFIVDFVSVSRWTQIESTTLSTWLSPDPLVLVKSGESIRVRFGEVDVNVAPTGDLSVTVKAVRVNRIVAGGQERLQLVR